MFITNLFHTVLRLQSSDSNRRMTSNVKFNKVKFSIPKTKSSFVQKFVLLVEAGSVEILIMFNNVDDI